MRMRPRLALVLALSALLAPSLAPRGHAQNPLHPSRTPRPGTPGASPATPRGEASGLPVVRIGALLPLTGVSAWYGKEMRQGMELALDQLGSPTPAAAPEAAKSPPSEGPKPAEVPAARIDPTLAAPGVRLALEALDVEPLDRRQATAQFNQLVAGGARIVFTASATPTAVVHPLATTRDVLLVHQGVVTSRLPAASPILIHTRASVATRVDTLAAHARERGFRRLGLLAAGDEVGKAVRAALVARWTEPGQGLAHQESLSVDAADLRSRLRQLVRAAPDAVVLAFTGADLGDLARQLRDAGYAGPLLALDDDPGALLAAGAGLDGADLLSEAFVPQPGSPSERFAEVYRKKFGTAPSLHAAHAFEAVVMVAAGIRAAREEGRGTPGGARLRETLVAGRGYLSLHGGQVVLRDDGTIDRPLALFTVQTGAATFARYLRPAVPAGRVSGLTWTFT